MKKLFKALLMLLPFTMVIGCSPIDNTPTPNGAETGNTPIPTQDITTYLVLTRNGLFNGEKGQKFPDLFLENTIAYTAKAGEALPGKDKITSSIKNVEFLNWLSYENDGKPTIHSKVPSTNNKILYAFFHNTEHGGNEGGGEVTPPNPPVVTTMTYIKGLNEGSTLDVPLSVNPGNEKELMAKDVTFKKDDKFEIAVYEGETRKSNVKMKSDLLNDTNFKNHMSVDDKNIITVLKDCTADFYVAKEGAWINVKPIEIIDPDAVIPTTFYLKVNAYWLQGNARFAAYFFEGENGVWTDMTLVENTTDTFTCDIPEGTFTKVIFCRMNPNAKENKWDNKWNQTNDLILNEHDMYTVKPDNWGSEGSWSTYTK